MYLFYFANLRKPIWFFRKSILYFVLMQEKAVQGGPKETRMLFLRCSLMVYAAYKIRSLSYIV